MQFFFLCTGFSVAINVLKTGGNRQKISGFLIIYILYFTKYLYLLKIDQEKMEMYQQGYDLNKEEQKSDPWNSFNNINLTEQK